MNSLNYNLAGCRVEVKDHPGEEFHCESGPGCSAILPGFEIRGHWDGGIASEIDGRLVISIIEEKEYVSSIDIPIIPDVVEGEILVGVVEIVTEAEPELPGFMTGEGGGDSGGAGASSDWSQPEARSDADSDSDSDSDDDAEDDSDDDNSSEE